MVAHGIRRIVTGAVLALTLVSCGGEDDSSAEPGSPTLTFPGRSPDAVTDVVAYGLTPEQIEDMEKDCRLGTLLDDGTCIPAIPAGVPLPPCRPWDVCAYFGRSATDASVGLIIVVEGDERADNDVCDDGSVALCDGVTVPVEVVEPLIEAAATSASNASNPSTSTPPVPTGSSSSSGGTSGQTTSRPSTPPGPPIPGPTATSTTPG